MADAALTFHSYVPGTLVRQLAGRIDGALRPDIEHAEGALLFADVAGFTALAEELAELGAEGAERLTNVLNSTFGELIEIVAESGGELLQFAGDAFLAVWVTDEGRSLSDAVARAAACGLRLHAAAREGLRLRTGVAAGPFDSAILGGVAQRWLSLAAGRGLEDAYAAGELAEPGEVVLSPTAHTLLKGRATGLPRNNGHLLLHEVTAPSTPPPESTTPAVPPEVLRPFLPRTVAARLDAGQTDWLAEFRLATVLFANIDRLDFRLPHVQEVTRELQEIVYRYEGSIHQFIVDDKGVTLIAAWGLPLVTHEDDPVRAVEAARAIRTALAVHALGTSIGITTGRIFCGSRGNARRREFAILGAVVNLSARLMQNAGEGILCDADTADRARDRITFGAVPPLQVKGRDAPVTAFRPRVESRVERSAAVAVIGRARERQVLTNALEELVAGGSGATIVLEGEAGIGKSSLISFVQQEARSREVRCIHGEADALDKLTAYHPWRQAFERLQLTRERILSELRKDETLHAWAPLLNDVVPLGIPNTDVARRIVGQARADSIRELLVFLLQGAANRRPLLLILDDLHWCDTASWTLAAAVARRVRPLVLLLATRPMEDPPAQFAEVLGLDDTTHVPVVAMRPEDSLALLQDRLGVQRIQPAVTEFVHERAQGNPLFTEQLALALRDAGHLRVEGDACRLIDDTVDLSSLDLPTTVQGVITVRIDSLSPQEQLTLKVASTIGHAFSLRTLHDIYPMPEERDALPAHLGRLQDLDLTVPGDSDPDPGYLFKHVITQQVAYTLMAFAQRRQLHRAVAEWYERVEPDRVEENLPLLAHHWTQAGENETAVNYLERAAKQALERYANDEAVRLLSQAVELHDADDDTQRRSRWEWWLGKAHLRLARTAPSRASLLRSLRLLDRELPRTRIGLYASLAGQVVRQSAHRLLPTFFLGKTRGDDDALRQAADIHRERSEIAYHEHNPLMFLHASLSALNLAERIGFARIDAEAGGILGLVAGIARAHPLARYYLRRAVSVGESNDELAATGLAHMVAALYYQGVANWDQAEHHAKRGAALFESVGDQLRRLHCMAIFQGVCVAAARFDELGGVAPGLYAEGARDNLTQALAWSLGAQLYGDLLQDKIDKAMVAELADVIERGLDHSEQAFCLGILADAYRQLGRDDDARATAERTLQVLTEHPPTTCYTLPGISCMADVFLGLLEQAGSDPSLADAAGRSVEILRRFARIFPMGRARTHRISGTLALLSGRPGRAHRAWRRCVAAGIRYRQPLDSGLGHLAFARALPATDGARRTHLTQACELFESVQAHYPLALARNLA